MNATKIVGLVGLLIAIVSAFVDVPYGSALLLLGGLYVGWSIAAEDHVRVIVTAIALAGLSGLFNNLPEVGGYLATIYGGVATMVGGVALTIMSCNIYRRLKP